MKDLLWLVLLFGILACSNTNQQNDSTENIQLTSDNNAVLYRAFLVSVDHLRLREAPGLQSKTIANLRESEIVYSGDKPSNLRDTIELRGIRHIAPYWKVSTTTRDGWVYGGGLDKIYEGSKAITLPISFGQLVKDLNNVEKDKLEVSAWMADRITNEDLSNPAVNDIYLKLVLAALDEIPYDSPIYAEAEQVEVTEGMYDQIFDRKTEAIDHPYFIKARTNGFHIDAGEGMLYPIVSREGIASLIGGPFTESTKVYNEINEIEFEKPFMTDAAIYKPLELIAEHLDRRVKFASNWQGSIWQQDNSEHIAELWSYIKFGTSNTPAFEYPDNLVSPEFMISWRNIIKRYKSADWISELKVFVDQVSNNNGKRPE